MAKKKAAKKKSKAGIVDSVRTGFNRNMLPYWCIIARNGEMLCHSEAYATQEACDKTALQVAAQLGVQCSSVIYEN